MKIGILTLFYGNVNWGGVLQGYALKRAVENLAHVCGVHDCEVHIVDYTSGYNPVYPTLKSQISQYSLGEIAARGMQTVLRKLKRNKRPPLERREQLFQTFMESMRVDTRGYTDDELGQLSRDYDVLISGSDQVWNPNAVRRGFLQMGIEDPCKRISYAASIARDALSPHEQEVMLPAIRRFHAVSVREKTAKQFLDTYLGGEKTVHEVLDPTFLIGHEDWDRLAGHHFANEEPYAVCFFFSDSLPYRKEIEAFCQARGLKLKTIPHAAGKMLPHDEMGPGERLYDLGPCEFVGLMKHADLVFTDSFHGSVFSMIFEKPFCVFERDKGGKTSKNSRLYDLLDNFTLSGRLIRNSDVDTLERVMRVPIDYASVRSELAVRKERSFAFLTDAFGWAYGDYPAKAQPRSILTVSPASCTGCGACAEACTKGAIAMIPDAEGFMQPHLNQPLCIDCGLCQRVCPVLHPATTPLKEADLAYSKREDIRGKSSSGGVFYHLAQHVLGLGGVVYGAAFDADFSVAHVRATTEEELLPLLTSKYVQSSIGDAYSRVLADLADGKTVLFCGTPCQATALANLANGKRGRDNLVLIDFVCHGVPSPAAWESYLRHLREKEGEIVTVSFRDKSRGWHDYSLSVSFADGRYLSESHELNAYMRAFSKDGSLRASCYQCPAKGDRFASDLSLADAWKIETSKPAWADDKGVSLVIARTARGEALLHTVATLGLEIAATDYEAWCRYNPSLVTSTARPNGRRNAFFAALKRSGTDLWIHDRNVPMKAKLRYKAKRLLKAIKLDKVARRLHENKKHAR